MEVLEVIHGINEQRIEELTARIRRNKTFNQQLKEVVRRLVEENKTIEGRLTVHLKKKKNKERRTILVNFDP